ncbi:hypothetical protein OSCI_3200002 [Kamptonema sp. PCC 6506]|nr:hypothetical protein OSCI_3200002 [Kamptonema sp. PCC 6506]
MFGFSPETSSGAVVMITCRKVFCYLSKVRMSGEDYTSFF